MDGQHVTDPEGANQLAYITDAEKLKRAFLLLQTVILQSAGEVRTWTPDQAWLTEARTLLSTHSKTKKFEVTDVPLPIPTVFSIKETYPSYDSASLTLIAPDPDAGLKGRYTVLRVWYTGRVTCIGRELPLKDARKVAKRPSAFDGRPIEERTKR